MKGMMRGMKGMMGGGCRGGFPGGCSGASTLLKPAQAGYTLRATRQTGPLRFTTRNHSELKSTPKMVKIRLTRGGAKKRPFYHIVVTDQRNKRDGRSHRARGFLQPGRHRAPKSASSSNTERVDALGFPRRAADRQGPLLVKEASSQAAA